MPYRQHRDDLLVPLPRRSSDARTAPHVDEVTTAHIPVLNVASADRLCRLHRVRGVCQNAITAIDAALDGHRQDGMQ
ncbi:hypothetical protein GCM10012289_70190 [Nonomuraea cavernae]|uniref:Uncharacterized protein n=1 Tax=Nonomuraea cavernae TaxID=2045107 RepID=A0A918DS77_9ACTN|nr:hypothetical protein GCM10012289_70190 [Nonomuraea cavernae]